MKKSRVVFTAVAAAVFLMVGGLFESDILSISWHLVHGRDFTWDNHIVVLPIWWRPSSSTSATDLKLIRAATSGADVELDVTKRGSSYVASSSIASEWQRADASRLTTHSTSPAAFRPYTVVTTGGDVFCVGSGKDDDAVVSFACRVTGTDWFIRFVGDPVAASDARQIVGSLR